MTDFNALALRCEEAARGGFAPPDYAVDGGHPVAQHILSAIQLLADAQCQILDASGRDVVAQAVRAIADNAIGRVIEMQFVLEVTATALRARATQGAKS